MTVRHRLVLALLVVALWGGGRVVAEDEAAGRRVVDVSPALRAARGLPAFYRRHVDLRGFPILASAQPADRALLEAAWIIEHMLAKRPDILERLRMKGLRCCVMGHDERTTMVPEHASLKPAPWWDYRARGLGPGPRRPVVSCADENLLGYRGDPYAGENILIHEFAHAIDAEALRHLDPTFLGQLEATFAKARTEGLWQGTYAATNKEEYWAEGVQSWFDANRSSDGGRLQVNTRKALERHDPRLARLIAKAFGDNPWRYVPTRRRIGSAHLKGYDPTTAPAFRWPDGLANAYRTHEARKASGEGLVERSPLPAGSRPDRSPASTASTRIVFVNRRSEDVRIHWLDSHGVLQPYGSLRTGQRAERGTYAGHLWVVTDTKGTELARFCAARSHARAVIR